MIDPKYASTRSHNFLGEVGNNLRMSLDWCQIYEFVTNFAFVDTSLGGLPHCFM